MKYAIISDIHGNNIALQNVIADAKKNQVDAYIFVGDYCVCAPWPKDVTETLQNMKNAVIVKGNEENYLNIPESDDGQFEISRWSRNQLLPEQIEWLNQLPEQLKIEDGNYNIFIAHKSESFIGTVEFDNFGPSLLAEQNRSITHNEMLDKVNSILEQNKEFVDKQKQIPKGIYIFGHSHIQWHKEIDGHLYINPGSCGLPLDCETYFGAPYTLLTVDKGEVSIEERRIKYDVYDLINQVKETSQYKEAYVWSEVTFQEWIHSREHIGFFLKYVEEYANKIGDDRRPFAKETWREAFTAWEAHRKMNDTHITRVREEWLDIADSDWYMSYRKEDVIREILQSPQKAFHKKTWEVLCSSIPCFKNKKILIPSSGDNRAVFAFAALGADVVSCDICEKQLQYAKEIADRNNLNIQFCVQDTMKLSDIGSEEYDLVYTSEGVHVWINQLPEMYKNIARVLKKDGFYINYEIHPFSRPFAYEDGKPKEKEVVVLKDYEMTGPLEDGITYHWRLQDILNAICASGLMICRLEEMHDERDKGHFWFYEEERKKMSQEEIDSYYDRKKNPLSALPQWFTVCCVKGGR